MNKAHYPFKKNNALEENKMLDYIIAQKIQCSKNEKIDCLELLNSILEFSSIQRNHGLLRLESEMDKISSNFMRKVMELVYQGIEPNSIRTILQNYIIVGDYKGKALLEKD